MLFVGGFTVSYLLKEVFDALHIFLSRYSFKTAIDVDAGQFGMMKLFDCFGAVRVDSSAEQKRGHSSIAIQQVPVELVAGTAILRGFGVEQIIIALSFVG